MSKSIKIIKQNQEHVTDIFKEGIKKLWVVPLLLTIFLALAVPGYTIFQKDGVEESFVYKGDLNQLFEGFRVHNIEDITIEEPELDEIFMHYYKEESK